MEITKLNGSISYNPTRTIRKNIMNHAIKNATSIGRTNESGNAVVWVKDISSDVIISNKSLIHGLDRRLEITASVIINIGKILNNSIRINEFTPKKDSSSHSYV